jgi:dolichyl-phosphate-mannose--protein O-mannosyl transferase
LNTTDSIAFLTLILNIFLGLVIPTLQRPMLAVETPYYDYNSLSKIGLVKYDLVISNLGLVPLNKVIGSIDALSINITSKPYFSKYLIKNTDNRSNSFFEIDFLPPLGKVTVEVISKMPKVNNSLIPTSYVFSKEISGLSPIYIHTFNIIISAFIILFFVLIGRIIKMT